MTREGALLAFIRSYIAEHGHSPTVAQMCEPAGCRSVSTVCKVLDRLEQDGLIWRPRWQKRGVEIRERVDG